ncbi:hypothetical protein N9H93_03980 [Rhizobiaceae bacterium]|nr:hypothetical protein [Rhizobiaceae bacterium]
MAGQETQAGTIARADDFEYFDPIDESTSANQGIRIFFEDGSRIVYRLSGTGTVGATLRVYIERAVGKDGELDLDTPTALADLIVVSRSLASIERHTGRTEPDVVT